MPKPAHTDTHRVAQTPRLARQPATAWALGRMLALLGASLLTACGGNGGGTAAVSDNPTISAQIQDIKPDNAVDTVGVFVDLQTPASVTAGAALSAASNTITDAGRAEIQQQFLNDLLASARQPTAGASSTASCDVASLQTKIANAYKPGVGLAVKLDLNACELDLLPSLPLVKGVYGDMPLQSQGATAADVAKLNAAVTSSFNGTTAWPMVNSGSVNGNGRVVAVLDTGVEDRHPALAGKVLAGACFSTASNGGRSFCPNGSNVDKTSATAARSCAETWVDNPSSSDRAAAMAAGCYHGTGMAGAAAMNYNVGAVSAGGMAKSAQLLPVQVFNKSAAGNQAGITATSADLLAGIEWVTAQAQARLASGSAPIVALNMSLGGGAYSGTCDSSYAGGLFKLAFDKLRAQGVLPIVAAGNGGQRSAVSFPACVSNTVAVASAQLGYAAVASYSNFSPQVKVVAQGGDANGSYALPVLCANRSTQGDDCWSSIAGTSPATALVSGAVAALSSAKPGLTPAQIESSLGSNWVGPSFPSAKTIVDNRSGGSGLTKPALRVTANAYQLAGLTEPTTTNVAPPVTPDPVVGGTVQVCFYRGTNYQGNPACTTQRYGNGQAQTLTYSFLSSVGSLSIREVATGKPLAANTVTVTLLTNFQTSAGVSYAVDTPSIVGSGTVRKIVIAYP